MNSSRMLIGLVVALLSTQTNADQLSADTKLSCQAILCLSSATPPDECSDSLKRYFSIWDWDAATMVQDRVDFLNQCPVADSSPQVNKRMKKRLTRYAQNSGFYFGDQWFNNIDDFRDTVDAD